MGRPPCCDKVGIKKGPWTPEEDIILVSYIQEHGPGNWRSVPTNTGLMRCSKSCRLRWTNYLRPGIKRGNFTPHEEGMIIHLQALLGNKWAAIASYLPQRTDNDIKNYWNTHLKKKIKKFQSSLDPHNLASDATTCHLVTKAHSENKSIDVGNQASLLRLNQASTYASSTENISRLLEGWMKSSPKAQEKNQQSNNIVGPSLLHCNQAAKIEPTSCDFISHEDFESLLSFESMNNIAWEKSSSDSAYSMLENKQRLDENQQPPLSLLEKWLLDESTGQVEEIVELSPISDNLLSL